MTHGKTILAVDDEKPFAAALKILLQAKGYDVSTANDGRQALEMVASVRPDLIILDLLMPGMDGRTCLLELNHRYGVGHFAILVLTALQRTKEVAQLPGIEDYMVKPFDHRDLLARIDRILTRRVPGRAGATP